MASLSNFSYCKLIFHRTGVDYAKESVIIASPVVFIRFHKAMVYIYTKSLQKMLLKNAFKKPYQNIYSVDILGLH